MARESARGPVWDAQRRRVLERDGWTCAYCGRELIDGAAGKEGATVDHIEALALYGKNSNGGARVYRDDELISACRGCNSSKGVKALTRTRYLNPKWL